MSDNRELIADQISAHHKKLVSLTNEEKRLEYRTLDITELVNLGEIPIYTHVRFKLLYRQNHDGTISRLHVK